MFGATRFSPFEDIFDFQREADRLSNQLRNELPARSARPAVAVGHQFQVDTTNESWRLKIPMPGIDPQHVRIDVAGNTISVRAGGGRDDGDTSYEQTMTVPQFLDLDRIAATHRHGLLELTLPLKDTVKPRRIQIEGIAEDRKQIPTA